MDVGGRRMHFENKQKQLGKMSLVLHNEFKKGTKIFLYIFFSAEPRGVVSFDKIRHFQFTNM